MAAVALAPPFWAAAVAAAEAAIAATASAGAAVVGTVTSVASTVAGGAALALLPTALGPEIAIAGGSVLVAGAGAGAAVAGGSALAAGAATAAGAGAAVAGGSALAAGAATAATGIGGGSIFAGAGVFAVGVGVAAAVAGSDNSRESTSLCDDTDAPPVASHSGPSNGDSDSDSDLDDEKASDSFKDRPRLNKPILIPKNRMKDLLIAAGKEMYEKLKEVISDDKRKVWKNMDFRIDSGHPVHNQPNFKTWNLQVNNSPQSHAAKELVKEYGTHEKLLWDTFDPKNPPDYKTWVKGVLKLFDE